ncbi:hypothetical protein [Sporolactobacillus terrae]|uniref:hypothetical protein n=1 Tax=Sporolactobacillus terrae TaxID=269673 RepID=UPI00048F3BDC|nr:hypothetical protein [Sporolactobacillus terrae]
MPNFYKGRYEGSPQQKADKNYMDAVFKDKKEKAERLRRASYRSARSFINTKSTLAELDEFEKLIAARREKLEDD